MFSSQLLEHFEKQCPEAVMVRGVLENSLPPEMVDQVFEDNRQRSYTRKLLFSTVVNILGAVVFRVRTSIRTSSKLFKDELNSSLRAVYDKINYTETGVCAALVGKAWERMAAVIDALGTARAPLFPGYQTRIVDGNHPAATEHRIKPLRKLAGGALPGVGVVVLDWERELFHSVELSEDAYTQERKLALEVIGRIKAGEVWIGDRNFCTSAILWQIDHVGACFLVRRHKTNVRFEKVGGEHLVGQSATEPVSAQQVLIHDDHGNRMKARLICVQLASPTRDGSECLEFLTNLPKRFNAVRISEAYHRRWEIETGFAHLEKMFDSEIEELGHPRAALFAFCLSLIAWNSVSVVKAAMRKVHGREKVDEDVSMYYLTLLIVQGSQAIRLSEETIDWAGKFATMTPRQLANYLCRSCRHQDLDSLQKNKRGPKKPAPKRTAHKNKPHFATARVLQ